MPSFSREKEKEERTRIPIKKGSHQSYFGSEKKGKLHGRRREKRARPTFAKMARHSSLPSGRQRREKGEKRRLYVHLPKLGTEKKCLLPFRLV